jgi:pimeloyl-ACP methyl ester carboxylesterase
MRRFHSKRQLSASMIDAPAAGTVRDPGVMDFPGRDGVRLAYQELGAGRPLVLIHGHQERASVWVDSGLAGRLAGRGYRVIMPDLRARGDSARLHEAAAYPPDVFTDDGLALIDHLGLADYCLAGHSLGGRIVIRMLVRGAAPRRAAVSGQGLDSLLHGADPDRLKWVPGVLQRVRHRHFRARLG